MPKVDFGRTLNYSNGAPKYTHLNATDIVSKDGVHGRLLHKPSSNWQQNLLKRNKMTNMNDINKAYMIKDVANDKKYSLIQNKFE